jgi:hypothetical protein
VKKLLSCILLLTPLAVETPARAALITFSSNGTAADPNEWNSTGGATLAIAPHPAWIAALSGSSWVSYGQTGDPSSAGYFMPPNGLIVSFYQRVNLPFTPLFALITYRADDSTAFYINNTLVRPEAPMDGNDYKRCSDFPVGCTAETEVTLDITPFLALGQNTLRFDVAQRNSVSFGLNYVGIAFGEPGDDPVPEPSTYLTLGAGLVALGLCKRNYKA